MWQKQPSARKDNPIYSKKGQIIKKTSGLNYQYPFTVDPYLLEKYKEYIIRNNLIPPPTPSVPPPQIQRVQVFKSQATITIPAKNQSSEVTSSTLLSLIRQYDENIDEIFNNYSNFYLIYKIEKAICLYYTSVGNQYDQLHIDDKLTYFIVYNDGIANNCHLVFEGAISCSPYAEGYAGIFRYLRSYSTQELTKRVIIDDWPDVDHGGDMLVQHLKIWADRYPFTAEVKGSHHAIMPNFQLVITSNYSIDECFKNEKDREAIKRRITEHIMFGDATLDAHLQLPVPE